MSKPTSNALLGQFMHTAVALAASADPKVELAMDKRKTVDTATAARYLGIRQQTLYRWTSRRVGRMLPERDKARLPFMIYLYPLQWSVSEIKRLRGVV